jgi:hypothetical protein
MSPPVPASTGSAPNTPSEGNPFAPGHKFNRSISQPSLREHRSDDDPARPPSRARVTFSDRIETIRPLSTISSETETSLSTLRGHSAANSLSSIVSGNAPAPPRAARPSLNTVQDEDRPSTAGMVLDKFISGKLNGEVLERKRPVSAVSPTPPVAATPAPKVQAKRRSLFHKDSRQADSSFPTLPTSASDPALSKSFDATLPSPMSEKDESTKDSAKPKSASRKGSHKPRKVKSWANSIITKKRKHSKKSKARSPTPPPNAVVGDDEESDDSDDIDFEPNFDDDTTVTIVSPTDTPVDQITIDTSYASWQPRPLKRVDSDIMSPVIDLDAALGPFNTPDGSSPRINQRGFSAHRRAMHSANGIAPSHRRTESAPELVPFENRSSVIANASPMADVFEEEEPEDELTIPVKKTKPRPATADPSEPKVSVVEADTKQEGPAINWTFNDGLGLSGRPKAHKVDSSEPLSPRALSPADDRSEIDHQSMQESDSVQVVEDHEEPRTSSLTHSSDSTVTAQTAEDTPKQRQPVINLTLPLHQQSLMTPDTIASSFSSPDYRSSQIFDTERRGTGTSSMTDYPVMPSPRFGEPGPEVRVSTEVPSLTSSRSTMTSAMQNAFPLASPHRFGERTSSLSSDPSEMESRRRKRSSIASLSRLMGTSSSNSERSKLSIEQRPQSEHREPSREKKKKNNLGSRLKKFFQPREPSPSKS